MRQRLRNEQQLSSLTLPPPLTLPLPLPPKPAATKRTGLIKFFLQLNTIVVVALLNVFFPVAAIAATRSAFKDEKMRSQSMGFICAGLNIIMYGSPLSAMKTVVTTKSVKYMPFWLSFFLFLNGAIWAVYASLQHDVFLLVPNGVGFVFGTIQLILYGIYRNAKPAGLSNGTSEIAADEEEGLISRAPLLS